ELNSLVGARLQEVQLRGDCLCLGFFSRDLVWVVVDQRPNAPQIFALREVQRVPFKENKKPISLFLQAHFIGQRLQKVQFLKNFGRVLKLQWQEGAELEVRLIPRAANCIVHWQDQSVAFNKPLPLKEVADLSMAEADVDFNLWSQGELWLQ